MKDIPGFEGRYAITEDGKVWNYKTRVFQTLRGSGFMNKKLRRKRNYKTVSLYLTAEKKYLYFYIHRLVAQCFIPNPEELPIVNHKDGDQTNNYVSNLEWCTHRQNAEHARINGLTTRGKRNTSTKLTEDQVREIRRIYSEGKLSNPKIGYMFGVSSSNVWAIVHRRVWGYVK